MTMTARNAVLAAVSFLLGACGGGGSARDGAGDDAGGDLDDAASPPVIDLQDLDGIWANVSSAEPGVMPRDCSVVLEADVTQSIRDQNPTLPANPPGRRFLKMEGGKAISHWLLYTSIESCISAAFHQPGVEMVVAESTLSVGPSAFQDTDGTWVQEIKESSLLGDGSLFSMYELIKLAAGTNDYHEVLWSTSSRSIPFTSLAQNSGWSHLRRPR